MPKLTLSVEKRVIDTAKRIAEERGTSVSAMFSCFINSVSANEGKSGSTLGPLTRRALGLAKLRTSKTDRELIEDALVQRYGQ